MKKIIFVCLGNICRSPMAEMMMMELVSESNLSEVIGVESRATSTYEIGNPPHPGALSELKKQGVKIVEHHSKQINLFDFADADLIIGMDFQNIEDLKQMAPEQDIEKIHLAYESVNKNKVIEDPWYDHKFDRTYRQLKEVLPEWLKILEAK
ncbi:low molecular weight protein-tyrosine-phosphatase [Companilactobacillus jidongensis]|uniref:low molecular weight protein-tyrosine-phosphatase n=1 Tax=Companilactobacillus jidongensis TaxID=2486006 RepID=UPI000F79B12C|nr:low molecular weight protein-tyrosine-phosphatase [Companilactobacillus jidongensis]